MRPSQSTSAATFFAVATSFRKENGDDSRGQNSDRHRRRDPASDVPGSEAMAREGAFVVVTDRDLAAARGNRGPDHRAGGRRGSPRLDVTDDSAISSLS